MIRGALQRHTTWAEDRALQRCNPSTIPGVGVKTGPDDLRPSRTPTSHQHQSEKPGWHDANLFPAGRPLPLANADRPEFQLTLNQDMLLMFTTKPAILAATLGVCILAPGCNTPPQYERDARSFLLKRGVSSGVIRRLIRREPLYAADVDALSQYQNVAVLHLLGANPSATERILRNLSNLQKSKFGQG